MDADSLIIGVYIAALVFGIGTILLIDLLGLSGDFGETPDHDPGDSFTRGSAAMTPTGKATRLTQGLILVIRLLRFGVYFGAAGGLMGLVALAIGMPPRETLPWALAAGTGGVAVAWLVFRLRYRETNSLVSDADFIGARAVVLFSFADDDVSRVRVRLGQFTRDRTARIAAESRKRAFQRDEPVIIAGIESDVVQVREIRPDDPG